MKRPCVPWNRYERGNQDKIEKDYPLGKDITLDPELEKELEKILTLISVYG